MPAKEELSEKEKQALREEAILENIRTRRSVRKFLERPVEFEKLGKILDAGRAAPSAGNLQEWKFILVTDADLRKKITEACLQQWWMQDAPVHIVVCCQAKKVGRLYGERGERIYSVQGCSAAAENMFLAAHGQGLGACWVGAFDEDMLRRVLDIPEDVVPMLVMPVGYPAEVPEEPPKFALYDVVFVERWGNRIKDIDAYMGYYSKHVQKALKKGQELFEKVVRAKK